MRSPKNSKGWRIIFDDIVVHERNQDDHDKNLMDFLQRAKKKNLTLNRSKCILGSKELSFFGTHIQRWDNSTRQRKVGPSSRITGTAERKGVGEIDGVVCILLQMG